MTGGKRRGSRKMRGGQPMGDYSLQQGADFAKMTEKFHGGRRRKGTRKGGRKMRGGAADLATAFEAVPTEIHDRAGTAVLDQAIADLSKFVPAPQAGGRRKSRRGRRGGALTGSPVDAPSMLLRPEDEAAAFLNPQWVQENLVNPNFVAPPSAYIAATTGGARKTRKAKKAHRKAKKVHRKSKKASRKSQAGGKRRKASKKTRKSKKAHRKH
jgi:hypothetical protein